MDTSGERQNRKLSNSAAYERWEAIADDYGTECGRTIAPSDPVAYPMQIMSLLSDVQEGMTRGNAIATNDRINAAKLMLGRMKDAAREAERCRA